VNAVRTRLTYANVIATIALFLALGGSAYAVTAGKNTVKSKSIAKGAVKTSDIANKAVTAKKLKPGAVPSNAIAANSVNADKLGSVVTRKTTVALLDNTTNSATVYCKPGEQLLGGGSSIGAGDVFEGASTPLQANNQDPAEGAPAQGWLATYTNPVGGSGTATIFAWAICLQ
jgi:hypothetical protein